MNSQSLPWISIFSFILLTKLLVASQFPQDLSYTAELPHLNCYGSFSCGSITRVGYPFRGNGEPEYCGYPGLVLDCENDITTIDIQSVTFRVLGIDLDSQTMKIARKDVMESGCPEKLVNTSMDNSLFEYSSDYMNFTFLYGCPGSRVRNASLVSCTAPEGYSSVVLLPGTVGPQSCDVSVTVPVSGFSGSINSTGVRQAIKGGFEVKWKVDSKACSDCIASNGRRTYEIGANRTTFAGTAGSGSPEGLLHLWYKTVIGLSASAFVLIILNAICYFERKGILSVNVMAFHKKERLEYQNVKVFIRQYGSLAPKQYRYSDINKMTNAFKEKLGEGGYGSVYKGKLSDGGLVAVKILSDTKGNGEEFINEVVSISRTSHVNVVALLGFCFERNKRALIYEFVAKGSLDKFIYNDESLEWKTLYQIAVGTARGLEYLHRGCSTRIVHFDIKPHNILLDEDFCPKISDFGLAKLCQRKQSIISMLGARGTPGYIAPEVFSRVFGGVSHKSDVYSYGMLVLEIIGARENPGIVQTSEVYFPQWIYEHLEYGKDLRLVRIATREEEETARKMILVGLWCIQTFPSDRPPMSKVLEMLEGSLESLQIPPKPSFLSPSRLQTSACDSSSSVMDLVVEMSESNPSSFQVPSKQLQFSIPRSSQSTSSPTSA